MYRIILIAFGLILLIVLIYAGIQAFRLYRLIGISAHLVAKSEPFEQNIPGGKPRILIVGDSTAVGTGVNDPTGSIAGRFAADFQQAEIQNFAVNGMRVSELADRFPSFPADSFDLVVIQIGANDIIHRTPMDEFTSSLTTVFDKANDTGTHVVALHSGNIGLAPLFPWPLNSILRSRTLTYREQYMSIAAEKDVTYVNLYREAANDPFKDEEKFYAADKLHLTEAGYGHWYAEIRAALQQAVIDLEK